MAKKKNHFDVFDSGTLFKLDIFQKYTERWLPKLIQRYPEIQLIDFFSGQGKDKLGVEGSPLRIVKELLKQTDLIKAYKVQVTVVFNDKDSKSIEVLKSLLMPMIDKNNALQEYVSIQFRTEDFDSLYSELLPNIKRIPTLFFADQFGAKYSAIDIIRSLERTEHVDGLFFCASSAVYRFVDESSFKKYFPIEKEKLRKHGWHKAHQTLCDMLADCVSKDSDLRILPFSLKKPTTPNIYGVIFCASHVRAIDTFLHLAWKLNDINGNANYDIELENRAVQGDLFAEEPPMAKISKVDMFQQEIESLVLSEVLTNNKEVIDYTYSRGHIPKHARDAITKMKSKKLIYFSGRSCISYDQVYKPKAPNIVKFEVLKQ